jgi:selenide, water dikinase
MQSEFPVVKDLVLIGGGHAHALVLRMWAMRPLAGVRVTVINPAPIAPYTGMLPGHIAGHYTRDEIMIDLVRLARFAGARVILDRVVGIDRDAKQVILAGRPAISYDVACIDIGISSDLPEVTGYDAHGVAAKPLGDYAARWQEFIVRDLPSPNVVVIGAGVGGVELALASAHRLGGRAKVTLLQRSAEVLPNIGAGARAALRDHLTAAGVEVLIEAEPAEIKAQSVTLQDGRSLASDFTLAVAGGRPQAWLSQIGVETHAGFITVGPSLQSSDPAIFAAGDCAHLGFAPRPKAGVFAVREAPILLHNLRSALAEKGRMRPYRPQRDYLKLISTGGQAAVADKWGLRLEGAWLWRWKDQIDRKFMAKFADYPSMTRPLPAIAAAGLAEAMGPKPLCGGCGAKLGAADLSAALAAVPPPTRAEVISGRGDDAAILATPTGVQVLSTDHLRAFSNDARLMARIAALHAMGDVWAMGAQAQVALAQVTLPPLSPQKGGEMLAEIMTAAAEVFTQAGADIVGGHSSIGAELTIGFTVTGIAQRAVTKGGAQAGDVLLLTKPIGTGTVMAAEMAMTRLPDALLGEAVAATFAAMCQSNGAASARLADIAHAMTDVTGFGLGGHLLEILDASQCAARLDAAAIPLLPAAKALAAAGVASSLAPANRAASIGRITGSDSPIKALLYDPQTAGGLLAVLPRDQAQSALQDLQAMGYQAAIIGEIIAGTPRIELA